MIFDSQEYNKLKSKYQNVPLYDWPGVLLLGADENLVGEKAELERLIQTVAESKQKDWLGRLVNTDWQQFYGAWFEMMLYGWLCELGEVQAEPEIQANRPDFSLRIDGREYILEAQAILITPGERENRNRHAEVKDLLESIKLPYGVNIEKMRVNRELNRRELCDRVIDWLSTEPNLPFYYEGGENNRVVLNLYEGWTPKNGHVVTMDQMETRWTNSEDLKPALKGKSKQHKLIRAAGYPYIIAVYLEDYHLSAQEVVGAWLGKEQVTINIETHQVVSHQTDLSGLVYWKRKIYHQSVGGILVFRSDISLEKQKHCFTVSYVENPYATVKIDPSVFPISSAFLVTGRTDTQFEMGWIVLPLTGE